MSLMNTPYDDVFRTLLTDCRNLIIPIVNEVFHTHYEEKQEVILLQNEIFIRQQNEDEEKVITDSSFAIVNEDNIKKRYHLECQSTTDGSMIIRMYEYDSQIALNTSTLEGNTLTVNFPDSAILYLRHTKNTPEYLTIVINTSGGTVSYRVPTLKVKQYTIDIIFDKRLFFLIPFYIFNYETKLKVINADEQIWKGLHEEYEDILCRLEHAVAVGILDEYTKRTICEMTNKVVKSLTGKYENIYKEVTDIMGGKVLEHEAKTILKQGIEQGIEQGICASVAMLKKLNHSTDIIIQQLMDNYNLSEEEARAYLEEKKSVLNGHRHLDRIE